MADGGQMPQGRSGDRYRMSDPELFTRNMMKLFDEGGRALQAYMSQSNGKAGPYNGVSEMGEAARVMGAVAQSLAADPSRVFAAQGKLAQDYAELWGRSMRRMFGETVAPVAEPEPGDNRFRDSDWRDNPFFDFWKQAYLLTSRWAGDVVGETQGVDPVTKRKAEFYVNQIAAALSPSNFAATNPEVLRETMATNGQNLLDGMAQLAADLRKSGDVMRISQTDASAFEVGRNLAVSPGKVVFQNEIIQLIQYAPTTPNVRETPVLMVPPWINKFYILDLVPEKSFVKWTVDQGYTVFMVSWVNPDARLSGKTFEDYMRDGLLTAIDAVIRQTGVGGTLLAAALAWMADKGDDRIASATFLTTQVDFSEAGDLLVFIDDTQLKSLEEMMAERGYLDGSRMATVFNMLRPKDLIWPYVVNNYLLGKKPLPFDLLFWNSDSTRMPAANHAFYLREFYRHNRLAKGEMTLGGVRLDLGAIRVPVYTLGTRDDHIAPARSVLNGARLFGGPVRVAIAGSGHIAGVVNPPAKKKYQYWCDGDDPGAMDAWLASAKEKPGSWWPDWTWWLGEHSGADVDPRDPAAGPLGVVEDAPGSYVRDRATDPETRAAAS
jgi:polyhydroxyalkanoate synthase